MLAALWVVTAGAASLSLDGACGGPVAIDVVGLAPGGRYAIVTSAVPGATTLAGGPCRGTTLGLASPLTLRRTGRADASGELHIAPSLPAPGACGLFVQVVDVDACTGSNVAQIEGGDGDGDGFFGAQDCDDGDPRSYPGAPELCDGKRTDCDDTSWVDDAGRVTWFGEDGTVTDYTALFASGTAASPVSVSLTGGGGELAVCEGTHHVALDVLVEGDVSVIGVGGSAATVLQGDGALEVFSDGAVLASGLTLTGSRGSQIVPTGDDFDVELRDIVLDVGFESLMISDALSGSGPLTLDGLTGRAMDSVWLGLRDHGHTISGRGIAAVTATLQGRSAAECDANLTDVRVGASVDAGLWVDGCTVTLVDLTASQSDPGVEISGAAVVDALRLTLEDNGSGLLVRGASSFVGSEVTVNRSSGSAVSASELAEVTLTDSWLERGYDSAIVADGASVSLVDSVVRWHSSATSGGGARLANGASLTCTRDDAVVAGFFSNSAPGGLEGAAGGGAQLAADPGVVSLVSMGCDWDGNAPHDVQVGGILGGPVYDYDWNAWFSCTSSDVPGSSVCGPLDP